MAITLPDARQLSDDVLEALRLRALRGRELGFTEADLAGLLGVSRETVCRWWSAYAARGLDALPHERTGRPLGSGRLLSDEQASRVEMAEKCRQMQWRPAVIRVCLDRAGVFQRPAQVVHSAGGRSCEDIDLGAGADDGIDDVVVSTVQRRHQWRFAARQTLTGEEEVRREQCPDLSELPRLDEVDKRIDVSHPILPPPASRLRTSADTVAGSV